MAAIKTVADLFNAGAEFDVVSFLSGQAVRFDTVTEMLRYNIGGDFQADEATVGVFTALVQRAMEAGRTLEEGDIPSPGEIPRSPTATGSGEFTHQGAFRAFPCDENGNAIDEGVWLPFSINAGEPLSPEQLGELLANSGNVDDFIYKPGSPTISKREEKFGYLQQRYGNLCFDVKINSIYRS